MKEDWLIKMSRDDILTLLGLYIIFITIAMFIIYWRKSKRIEREADEEA